MLEQGELTCDMRDDCANPVTHIGEKGYAYCAGHAPDRAGWERTRRLTSDELTTLRAGKPLATYSK